MIQIENDWVPPGRKGVTYQDMPMDKLGIGDSFVVPFSLIRYTTVKTRAFRYSQDNGKQLRVFKEENGTRVYRAR